MLVSIRLHICRSKNEPRVKTDLLNIQSHQYVKHQTMIISAQSLDNIQPNTWVSIPVCTWCQGYALIHKRGGLTHI